MMMPQKDVRYRKLAASTDLQKVSQAENFAIFAVKGMLSTLKVLAYNPALSKGVRSYLTTAAYYLEGAIDWIKMDQENRMKAANRKPRTKKPSDTGRPFK